MSRRPGFRPRRGQALPFPAKTHPWARAPWCLRRLGRSAAQLPGPGWPAHAASGPLGVGRGAGSRAPGSVTWPRSLRLQSPSWSRGAIAAVRCSQGEAASRGRRRASLPRGLAPTRPRCCGPGGFTHRSLSSRLRGLRVHGQGVGRAGSSVAAWEQLSPASLPGWLVAVLLLGTAVSEYKCLLFIRTPAVLDQGPH